MKLASRMKMLHIMSLSLCSSDTRWSQNVFMFSSVHGGWKVARAKVRPGPHAVQQATRRPTLTHEDCNDVVPHAEERVLERRGLLKPADVARADLDSELAHAGVPRKLDVAGQVLAARCALEVRGADLRKGTTGANGRGWGRTVSTLGERAALGCQAKRDGPLRACLTLDGSGGVRWS